MFGCNKDCNFCGCHTHKEDHNCKEFKKCHEEERCFEKKFECKEKKTIECREVK